MIASLQGTVAHRQDNHIVVTTGGIGYLVTLPRATVAELPQVGAEIHLWVYTHVKEDALQLFGFRSWEERSLFQLLLSVSGIGPKAALELLGNLSPEQMERGIANKNVALFTQVPGIGRKTAERLIIELTGKLQGLIPLGHVSKQIFSGPTDEATQALVALGYRERDIRQVMVKLEGRTPRPKPFSLEEMIREALQILS